ncbi:amine acid ABC transporter, permease protein, 3-TM region, His/Glu/Gln/Arg/opine family [Sphaerochaeta pleomorpha str. Grapes]|uniref:Putative glutamine transport system permease protein GlnP n=1 Tax=Sphaerochaeta pleomorpha (strain ATCC BAA-1885 / DSM 22778 / Grapes) TaxID=158190 RepID=G8QTQ5_SPHPG|nr:amino acid ABC transporter permease [Sphaerochaeta pleomorpha]AEV28020.1 amine acid ABC transporter, permease protein, 3-TM region, His/Glu/Gln/Arg/opine family [Sphaerochaeta pleomorpha str. Grapes]
MSIFPWDLSIVPQKFFLFWEAASYTLEITFFGVLFGLLIGLLVALGRLSKNKALSSVCRSYIFLIRGTPLLVQLFIIYYGLTSLVTIAPIPSAIIALAIHNGAYIGEIFRGAIQSIHYGQLEAAKSIGMTHMKAMERIVLPQAFKRAVPSLGNQLIIALKDSSLASTIAVPELMLKGRQMGSSTFMYMEMFIIVGIWYLLMTSVLSFVMHKIEMKLKVSDRG